MSDFHRYKYKSPWKMFLSSCQYLESWRENMLEFCHTKAVRHAMCIVVTQRYNSLYIFVDDTSVDE